MSLKKVQKANVFLPSCPPAGSGYRGRRWRRWGWTTRPTSCASWRAASPASASRCRWPTTGPWSTRAASATARDTSPPTTCRGRRRPLCIQVGSRESEGRRLPRQQHLVWQPKPLVEDRRGRHRSRRLGGRLCYSFPSMALRRCRSSPSPPASGGRPHHVVQIKYKDFPFFFFLSTPLLPSNQLWQGTGEIWHIYMKSDGLEMENCHLLYQSFLHFNLLQSVL